MTHEPEAWRELYPFASHYLELPAGRLHYLDEGQGPPLLLVHGNPTWSFYWRHLVVALRGQYRLIVPDHLGCGLSDKPARFDYCLARHVDHLHQLIERLDLREATLLAHDWGGAIGMGAVLRQPERFRRFALFNTAAFRSPDIPWRIAACRIPLFGPLAVQGGNAFARAALRMATVHPERFTPLVRAGYLAPYDSWEHRRAVMAFVNDIPLRPTHRSYATLQAIEAGLPSLAERPMLLTWGLQDWCFTTRFLERFQEFFPRAEVCRLADAGHYVVEDAHERIVPRLRQFLQSTQ